MADLKLLTICGSLRKGSYNAMVQRALPSLAPEGMTIEAAPSFAEFPLYNADVRTRAASRLRSTPSPTLFERPMASSSSHPSIIFQSQAA